MDNIHASCVSYQQKGVLILGPSGCGKSDLCLRLILNHQAILVADDRVDLNVSHETSALIASAPSVLAGLLEVRGLGIMQLPYLSETQVKLAVELTSDPAAVDRMPQPQYLEILGLSIPKITLYPFEVSAPEKIIASLQYEVYSK